MPLIAVDPVSLRIIARDLARSIDVAGDVARHRSRLMSYAAGAGRPSVTAAIGSFLDRWSYGCGCLVSDTRQLAASVSHASGTYRQVDARVAKAGLVER
jgi:hypothetical protein